MWTFPRPSARLHLERGVRAVTWRRFGSRWTRSLPMEPGTFWMRRIVRAWIAVLACLVLARDAPAQPDRGPGQDIPPWKRQLSGEAAARVSKLEQQIAKLQKE